MTLRELLDQAELVRQRGYILRELFVFIEREWPRGGQKYCIVDGVKRRVRPDAVEEVRRVILRELTDASRERRALLGTEIGEVSPAVVQANRPSG